MTALAWVIGIGIFVFLLFRFPRKTIALVVAVVVLAGAGFAWMSWDASRTRAAYEQDKRTVVTAARFDPKSCVDPAWPILVVISNKNSSRTLNKVSFDLVGKRDGFSGSILSGYQNSDKILAPGEIYGGCWSLPYGTLPTGTTAADLTWTANVSYPEWAP